MADIEVHIHLDGRTRQIGLARSNRVRGRETIIFGYEGDWLEDPDRFSLEPALALGRGAFAPPAGFAAFGSIGDSAPDTWGRRLMQRTERRLAEREGRVVRTLLESDYLPRNQSHGQCLRTRRPEAGTGPMTRIFLRSFDPPADNPVTDATVDLTVADMRMLETVLYATP